MCVTVKIMTQGFKMRSQPLFICPALWPRYCCGEGEQQKKEEERNPKQLFF